MRARGATADGLGAHGTSAVEARRRDRRTCRWDEDVEEDKIVKRTDENLRKTAEYNGPRSGLDKSWRDRALSHTV